MATENILSDADIEMLKKALADAEIAQREIEKAKRAGLDVSHLEERLKEAVLQLQRIRQVYVVPKGK